MTLFCFCFLSVFGDSMDLYFLQKWQDQRSTEQKRSQLKSTCRPDVALSRETQAACGSPRKTHPTSARGRAGGHGLSDTTPLFTDRPPQAARFRTSVSLTPVAVTHAVSLGSGPVPHGDLSSTSWPDRVSRSVPHLAEGWPAWPTADSPPRAEGAAPPATVTPAQHVPRNGAALPPVTTCYFHRGGRSSLARP